MFSFMLVIIYISFISLGLPDALLGSAWPIMYKELDVPISAAGTISLIISLSTVISSLTTDRLTKKFSTAVVTTFSIGLTGFALFGYAFSSTFLALCLFSIPYGLGAGAIDAALNNYVSIHYSSGHMNWLHCFWGVGATISPYIMSYALFNNLGWSSGYIFVGVIQVFITILLFFSIPKWEKTSVQSEDEEEHKPISFKNILKLKGVKYALVAFFCYCALEGVAGLWACTYLVGAKGIDAGTAAMFASLYYGGITIGRFFCGFIAEKFDDKNLIRYALVIILFGILLMFINTESNVFTLAGLVIIGLGCAPIYPTIIHTTPSNFGEENSQAVIGVQMASAYMGLALAPPMFGLIAQYINIALFPLVLLLIIIVKILNIERLWKVLAK